MMEKITNILEAQEIINQNDITLVYIGQENCSVCHSLKPQVQRIMKDFNEVKQIELDAIMTPTVAEAFQVLTVPVILLFIEGQEYLRRARALNTSDFKKDVTKIILGYQEMVKNEGI